MLSSPLHILLSVTPIRLGGFKEDAEVEDLASELPSVYLLLCLVYPSVVLPHSSGITLWSQSREVNGAIFITLVYMLIPEQNKWQCFLGIPASLCQR